MTEVQFFARWAEARRVFDSDPARCDKLLQDLLQESNLSLELRIRTNTLLASSSQDWFEKERYRIAAEGTWTALNRLYEGSDDAKVSGVIHDLRNSLDELAAWQEEEGQPEEEVDDEEESLTEAIENPSPSSSYLTDIQSLNLPGGNAVESPLTAPSTLATTSESPKTAKASTAPTSPDVANRDIIALGPESMLSSGASNIPGAREREARERATATELAIHNPYLTSSAFSSSSAPVWSPLNRYPNLTQSPAFAAYRGARIADDGVSVLWRNSVVGRIVADDTNPRAGLVTPATLRGREVNAYGFVYDLANVLIAYAVR